jgi:hypothetical protein
MADQSYIHENADVFCINRKCNDTCDNALNERIIHDGVYGSCLIVIGVAECGALGVKD